MRIWQTRCWPKCLADAHLRGGQCTMWRILGASVLGTIICAAAILPAVADDQKTEIKGGIDGKVKAVDVEGKKLTIITPQGRERTFIVTDETIMVGPRGGKVRKHLHDPRFHEGFHVIIVANGNTAEEVHLGFARDSAAAPHEPSKTATTGTRGQSQGQPADRAQPGKGSSTLPTDATAAARHADRHKEATKLEEEDDEEEILGHVKNFDESKRILVITLLNGKNRSFLLAHNVPVLVKGI